jgi:uncharacterized protein YcfL
MIRLSKGIVGGKFMNIRHTVQLSVLLVGAVFLTACATSGMEATGKPGTEDKFAKHLVIHNESLARDIMITDMKSRTRGDLLQVSVTLENLSSSDKNIQYRFSWYDADNFEVAQEGRPWTPVILHGNATVDMQAVAPNASVKTYKVNVRELP